MGYVTSHLGCYMVFLDDWFISVGVRAFDYENSFIASYMDPSKLNTNSD